MLVLERQLAGMPDVSMARYRLSAISLLQNDDARAMGLWPDLVRGERNFSD